MKDDSPQIALISIFINIDKLIKTKSQNILDPKNTDYMNEIGN